MIEKDIQLILGVSESYRSQWGSSIKESDLKDILENIIKITKLDISGNTSDIEGLIDQLDSDLSKKYDDIVPEQVIDMILFSDPDIVNDRRAVDNLIDKIVELGDRIMNKYGTEPRQVLNAFNDALRTINKNFDIEPEEVNEIFVGKTGMDDAFNRLNDPRKYTLEDVAHAFMSGKLDREDWTSYKKRVLKINN